MQKRVQTTNENERKKSEIPDHETDDYDRRGVNFVTRFVGPTYTRGCQTYIQTRLTLSLTWQH